MDIYWLMKVTIVMIVFPLQATFMQASDYEDSLDMLNEVVNSIVEQSEQPSNEEIGEMTPINQSFKSDTKNNKSLLSKT